MSLSEDEIRRFFRIHKTLSQMLNDRGYIVTEPELGMTHEQFVDKYGEEMKREDLVILKIKRNDDSDKLIVFFPDEPKIGIKQIKPYIRRMESEKIFRAIFVVKQDFTPVAREYISSTTSSKIHLEVFKETELLMNVKEHAFVPVHIALTTEEKKAMLERYTVKENQLPRIQFTDPIAKYYGLKRGEIVKIIRPSETAGRYVTYRYVV